MHRIHCRLLEEERRKRANQGVWCWAPRLPARFALGEPLSACFPTPAPPLAGLLLPSVASQGIAGKLHVGKKGQECRDKASEEAIHLPRLSTVRCWLGTEAGAVPPLGLRAQAGSCRGLVPSVHVSSPGIATEVISKGLVWKYSVSSVSSPLR